MPSLLYLYMCLLLISVCATYKKDRHAVDYKKPQQPQGQQCSAFDGTPGTCTTLVQCNNFGDHLFEVEEHKCALPSNGIGVCCPQTAPVGPEIQVPGPILNVDLRSNGPAPKVSPVQMQEARKAGQTALEERLTIEKRIAAAGISTPTGSPQDGHNQIVFTFPRASKLAEDALVVTAASLELITRLNLKASEGASSLPLVGLNDTEMKNLCPPTPICLETKYRSFDGSCNNLRNKDWGKSFRAHNRLMRPAYSDGFLGPRVAVSGAPLPSARFVSTTVLPDFNRELPAASLYVMSWGQFVSHDLQLTPINKGLNGSSISCCQREVLANPRLRHPECLAIEIPADDEFYANVGQTCMEFVRSIGAPRTDCTLGPREQMNQLTSFLDGSVIYGSTPEDANALRSNQAGKLQTSNFNGKGLPPSKNKKGCMGNPNAGSFCFLAGDVRVNQQPQLTTLHVIFLREHNRITDELVRQNPAWNDEILYKEARRIVGALIQHITFTEFLPILLGRNIMKSYELLPLRSGYTSNYDPSLDPTILNEFAVAAYRFGHSIVPGILQLGDGAFQRLHETFLRPYSANLLDRFLSAGANQPSQAVDNFISEELTTHLFQSDQSNFGLDLAAINIQRSRDHGIPGYNAYRVLCGLEAVKSFADVSRVSDADVALRMSKVYQSVDDIDLWVGGISETPLPGAIVGPTLACLLGEQFRRLRNGDRFWYEMGDSESSFSIAQLKEIRKVSLARIICDNSDGLTMMPRLAFFRPAKWNRETSCNDKTIPRMSLHPWRNEPVWS